eukprot:Opistho-2@48933
MNTKIAAILVLVLAAACGSANARVTVSLPKPNNVGLDLCPTCVSFAGQGISQLLSIIANAGVIGTCGQLCGDLKNATGSGALGLACNLFCDYEGIKAFIAVIDKADLDPIYFCELLNQCSVNDNGDAKVAAFTVSPASGPQGTTFTITLQFTSANGTGTGQINLDIETVDQESLGSSNLLESQKAGNYQVSWQVDASPDPDCDPTEDDCEDWDAGDYPVSVALCNGQCGSKHPHSAIYATASAKFTITA